jgi:hypothetical protein
MSEIEHVNVKLFARNPVSIDWANLIPVFHRWIQQQLFPELLLIDVADYATVPAGPGVMLIGHRANISLDNRQNLPGLLYNRKTVMEGSFAEKLRHSYEVAQAAARRLEQEPEFRGKVAFDDSDVEVFINDRLLAPNRQETWNLLREEIATFFGLDANLEWNSAPRELFRVRISRVSKPQTV